MGPTDTVVLDIASRFFQIDLNVRNEIARTGEFGCQDFMECLREACPKGTEVTNGDARAAHDVWLGVHAAMSSQLQSNHHLAFAKHMAKSMAPFFCKGPPPPPVPVESEVPEYAPASACGAIRVIDTESQRGWLGVLGAAVLLIITAPMRFEFKFSEYIFSIYPQDSSRYDIT